MMQKLSVAVLMIVLAVSSVSAFGVSAPYFDSHPLILQPGQTTDTAVYLQNLVDTDGDIIAVVSVGVDAGLSATLVQGKSEYLVKKGQKDVAVPLRVMVDKDVKPGTRMNIQVAVSQKTAGEGQSTPVRIVSSYRVIMPVQVPSDGKVVEMPAPIVPRSSSFPIATFVVTVAVLGALVVFLLLMFHHHKPQAPKPSQAPKRKTGAMKR